MLFSLCRGEMLIRTDRVCKMWRGGRIESYRALVIGGNLRGGCGGFGVGKAFEPEDAVEIGRMARRNILFVDRAEILWGVRIRAKSIFEQPTMDCCEEFH